MLNLNLAEKIKPEQAEELEGLKQVAYQESIGIFKLNPATIRMTDHAYSMAKDRFGLPKDKALTFFRDWLKNEAVYICEMVDEKGSRTHLYGYRGVIINIGLNYEQIITVYKNEVAGYVMPPLMKEKTVNMFKSEIKRMLAKEDKLLKKLPYIEAEVDAELYPLKFLLFKTTSKKKIAEAEQRIADLQWKMATYYKEIEELQIAIRQTARSLSTIL